MKKIILVLVIFSLILSTAIIKNSAKKNEDKIFTVKENIRVLNSELEKIKLEFDYLSSSDKLLEFQSLYFENDLIQKKIENIKVFKIIMFSFNVKILSSFFLAEFLIIAVDKINEKIIITKAIFFITYFQNFLSQLSY